MDRDETVTIAAQCFGVRIGVQCRRIDAQAVSNHLPMGYKLIDPVDKQHLFILAPEPHDDSLFSVKRWRSRKAVVPQKFSAALKTLQKQVHLCVAEHTSTHVFIHAGVILWKNRLIVFPGSSYAGKSTLVWALVQAGAVYYSDEYAVFDEDGYVHSFALPLNLRLEDGSRRMIRPAIIGTDRQYSDLIVFAKYRPGAVWNPHQVSPATAVMGLIKHSIAIRRNPELVIPVLKRVSLQSQSFMGVRGESEHFLYWLELTNR